MVAAAAAVVNTGIEGHILDGSKRVSDGDASAAVAAAVRAQAGLLAGVRHGLVIPRVFDGMG